MVELAPMEQASPHREGPPEWLRRPLRQVEQRIPQWLAAGGHITLLEPLAQLTSRYITAGSYRKAHGAVEVFLSLLSDTPQQPCGPITARLLRSGVIAP